MNNIIVLPNDLSSDRLVVIHDEERLNHLRNILKVKKGESVRVCLVDAGLTKGHVEFLDKKEAHLRLEENVVAGSEPSYSILVGWSRPQTIKKVLEYGTTMGVKEFFFIRAELSEKSYSDSKVYDENEMKKYLLAGLSQSGCYYKLPNVRIIKSWHELSWINNYENRFVFSKEGKTSFKHYANKKMKKMLFAIGPERGWTKNELNKFSDIGFTEIFLYPSILRVECAMIAGLSQIELFNTEDKND